MLLSLESEKLIRRFLSVRRFSKNGERKIHKPLLQLLALSALAQSGSSKLYFEDVEAKFQQLLRDFGPAADKHKLQYPFRHMTTDRIWHAVDSHGNGISKVSSESVVRKSVGQLDSVIEATLRSDSELTFTLARAIADNILPNAVATDLLEDLGLVREDASAITFKIRESGKPRSAQWRRDVLNAWNGACAFCGYDGNLASNPVGLDAAHIRWFNYGGPDNLDNGLALCVLDHRLFDRGAIGLTSDLSIRVSTQYSSATDSGGRVQLLHGQTLKMQRGAVRPHDDYLDWHSTQVFKP